MARRFVLRAVLSWPARSRSVEARSISFSGWFRESAKCRSLRLRVDRTGRHPGGNEDHIGRNDGGRYSELPHRPGAHRLWSLPRTEADRFWARPPSARSISSCVLQDEDSVAASVADARGLQLDAVRATDLRASARSLTDRAAPSVSILIPLTIRIAPTRENRERGDVPGAATRRPVLAEARALKDLLCRVCDVMESPIVLPAALDDEQRYDSPDFRPP